MEPFIFFAPQDVIFPIIWLKHGAKVEGYVALIMLHTQEFGAMVVNNLLELMLFPRHTTLPFIHDERGKAQTLM